jgi:hypothetical protein
VFSKNWLTVNGKEARDFPFSQLCLKKSTLTNPEESRGFELHIKDQFTDADRDCIKAIAREHYLSVEKKDGHIIIYKQRKR